MRRILILGSPGSGKTTFARKLASALDLPLIHLDQIYWRPNWVEPSRAEWDRQLAAEVAKPEWIMDGNYGRTIAARLKTADTAIVLDFSTRTCLARAAQRVFLNWRQVRPYMAAGCPERFDLELFRFIWGFRKHHRSALMTALETFSGAKLVFNEPRQANRFLDALPQAIGV